MSMVDVSDKNVVLREAVAEGRLVVRETTRDRIARKGIRKGDPFAFAEAAGLMGVKRTHLLIPHCHPLPIEAADFSFFLEEGGVRVRCRVKSRARTGVEMEALMGVSVALNTLWDLVKYLEKDESGRYPFSRITDIRVLEKTKEPVVE